MEGLRLTTVNMLRQQLLLLGLIFCWKELNNQRLHLLKFDNFQGLWGIQGLMVIMLLVALLIESLLHTLQLFSKGFRPFF